MALNYFLTLREVGIACDEYFVAEPAETYQKPTKKELAEMDHPEWIPPEMYDYCKAYNGLLSPWSASAEQLKDHPECGGRIALERLQDIYGSWEKVVYFEDMLRPGQERLRCFKVVDMNADEAAVGLYHDQAQERELHYFRFCDGMPEPLGVDFDGYVQLLTLSLGYTYWPTLLVELNEHFTQHPAQTFAGPRNLNAKDFVADMTALFPPFRLEAFVALYDQVRLRR
jgi:hypothetical protein